MKKLKFVSILVLGVLAGPLMSTTASAATIVTLASCNVAIGPFAGIATISGFDQAECSFASTTTSSISTSNFGSMFIDPSAHGPYDVLIDLRTSSGWVNVFDSPNYAADTALSAILPATINFAALTADRLRLRSTFDEGWSFHNGTGRETFTLNDAVVTAAVPEPASLLLLGSGLAGTVAAARRRRRQQA